MEAASFQFSDLAGRTVLLTGASRGIGRAMVPVLQQQGIRLILTARNGDALREVQAASDNPEQIDIRPCDLSDPDARRRLTASLRESYPSIDGIVHNAAIDPRSRFSDLEIDTFRKVQATNVEPIIDLTRDLLEPLKAATAGRLVLLGSVTFPLGGVYLSAYVASKGAIVGLTRSLAHELGPEGITVNCLEPGAIQVEKERNDEARDQRVIDNQSVKRRLNPDDLSALLCYLLSATSGGMTGQVLTVDGGLIHPLVSPAIQGSHLKSE